MERYQMHEFIAMASRSFSLSSFDQLGLPKMITTALNKTDAWEKKRCALGAKLMVSLVLAINLYRVKSIYDVFQTFVDSMRARKRQLSLKALSEEAIYHARARLGVAPVQVLFEMTASQIQARAWFHGRRTWAADGVHFLVADTKENGAEFGRPNIVNGAVAFPQVKGVALVATETREIRGLELGPNYMSEQPCVLRLIERLGVNDLLLLDRGLPSFELFQKCLDRGVDFLARISSKWSPRIITHLANGDYLVEIRTRVPVPEGERKKKGHTRYWAYMTVRMIRYTFESTGESIRILTNLKNHNTIPAIELAMLYHERWECELTYDELKTHLESIPHGTVKTVFRSQTPEGVLQEAYGMAAVYNLVRNLMAKAARKANIEPDQISFVGALNVIKLAMPRIYGAPRALRPWFERQLLRDIGECRLPNPRRKRLCPRCVRVKIVRFPRKRPEFKERFFDYEAEMRLLDCDNPPNAA